MKFIFLSKQLNNVIGLGEFLRKSSEGLTGTVYVIDFFYDPKSLDPSKKYLLFSGENLYYTRTLATVLDKTGLFLNLKSLFQKMIYHMPECVMKIPVNRPFVKWYKVIKENSNVYAIVTNDLCHPRIISVPLFFVSHIKTYSEIERVRLKHKYLPKSKFCSFIVANPSSRERITFFKLAKKCMSVDSLGYFMNSVGGPVKNKLHSLRDYSYTICFENTVADSYITEKILDPLLVNAIPIYCGASNISSYINPACFINVSSFKSNKAVLEYINSLTEADISRMLSEKPFVMPAEDLWAEKISSVRHLLRHFKK